MINKIGVDSNTGVVNSKQARRNNEGNPNFKGLGTLALAGIQKCEQVPMINVAVIDMLSAILPRTIVESMTNWFAGFEAFRRESSGLFVNCIIPSFITLGIAKCLNPAIMPKGVNMSRCWADRNMVTKMSEYYQNASSDNRVEDSLKKIISDIQGFEGKKEINFGKELGDEKIADYARRLNEISKEKISNHEMRKEVEKISKKIVEETKVAENIKVGGVSTSSVHSLLEDSVKFFREFQRADGKLSMEEFAKKSRKLVTQKSLLGLSIVLPLAISMQYINRWITGKISGTKGAPIYEDFAKGNSIEETPKAKEGLLKQKIISISSMIGVSLLSMMKKPSMNMLEFKGSFPTMDQARIISTATFSSRMAAADDKNELAEATIRDIATFSSLYFLGDYASKAAATIVEKYKGVKLLNETKELDKNANALKKFWHWVKNVNIKSSEEVVSKTKEMLNGAKPTQEQAIKIEKEISRAKNLRAACQATNIGVSLLLLGIVIPVLTRKNTKRKHEKALKLAQENNISSNTEKTDESSVTPLNVKYSKLTAGFRAEEK
ncbi:hypothetical protein IJ750_00050 [bacterium]|nr:hypothetical protein [bacterium]